MKIYPYKFYTGRVSIIEVVNKIINYAHHVGTLNNKVIYVIDQLWIIQENLTQTNVNHCTHFFYKKK